MEGDLSFSDEIVLSGHELNFKYDFINDEARREVLGTMVDCPEPGDGLDILCHYDAARQDTGSGLSLTLYRHDGLEQRSFSYPLGKEERALLRKQMEADCLGRTGQTLNGYYAQLDLERGESPPELKGGTVGWSWQHPAPKYLSAMRRIKSSSDKKKNRPSEGLDL